MSALDTNVLVRYLVKDDVDQSKAARAYIRKHCTRENPAFINRNVICELVWVLGRNYGSSREQIAHVLEKIFQTRQFIIENVEAAWQALASYRHMKIDFADALIGIINKTSGYPAKATFDRHAAKLDTFLLLPESA